MLGERVDHIWLLCAHDWHVTLRQLYTLVGHTTASSASSLDNHRICLFNRFFCDGRLLGCSHLLLLVSLRLLPCFVSCFKLLFLSGLLGSYILFLLRFAESLNLALPVSASSITLLLVSSRVWVSPCARLIASFVLVPRVLDSLPAPSFLLMIVVLGGHWLIIAVFLLDAILLLAR